MSIATRTAQGAQHGGFPGRPLVNGNLGGLRGSAIEAVPVEVVFRAHLSQVAGKHAGAAGALMKAGHHRSHPIALPRERWSWRRRSRVRARDGEAVIPEREPFAVVDTGDAAAAIAL